MNFTQKNVDITGTSLKGYISISYEKLVEKVGRPNHYDSPYSKTQAEWHVKFTDGVIATIYDYKYDGDITSFTNWHVGGNSELSLSRIQALLA